MSSVASILVIGRQGQLASSLQALGSEQITTIGRPEFDLNHPENFPDFLKRIAPDFIVNAAAWTAVDLAETEPEAARRANYAAPAFIAQQCALRHIPLIHVSTDYVFNGKKRHPYTENDSICPETVYGRTKAEGEQAVLSLHPQSLVLRTSWVYSAYGRNFVKTMISAGAKNPVLKVVNDQKGNPTSSDDLAWIILEIISQIHQKHFQKAYHGIFNACGRGDATWFDLAKYALKEAARYGQKEADIQPISTCDWPTPAKRPTDSRLDTTKLQETFGLQFPLWQDSVARVVQKIFSS